MRSTSTSGVTAARNDACELSWQARSLWQSMFGDEPKPELGLLVILLLPSLAAVSSFKNIYVGGLNYLAFLSLLIPLALFLLVLVKAGIDSSRLKTWPGHLAWLIWYALIWSSLLWTDKRDADAFKFAFELSTPYLFALAGVMFVRDAGQLRWLLRAFGLALIPSLLCVGVWKMGLVDAGSFASGPALDARPHSMSLLPIASLAIALLPGRVALSLTVWACCLMIAGLEGSRGATLCMLLLPLFHPSFRGLRWRLAIAVGVVAMAYAVFCLPAMQARLFPESGSGAISDLLETKTSGMGRLDAWPVVLDRALERPVLGHGIASAFDFVPRIWDRMQSPHNEFLRIGYELGVVGIAVFLAAIGGQLFQLKRLMRNASEPVTIALTTVYLSLVAFLLMSLTDNPLGSNIRYLNPVFLLMGAAFACACSCPHRESFGHAKGELP